MPNLVVPIAQTVRPYRKRSKILPPVCQSPVWKFGPNPATTLWVIPYAHRQTNKPTVDCVFPPLSWKVTVMGLDLRLHKWTAVLSKCEIFPRFTLPKIDNCSRNPNGLNKWAPDLVVARNEAVHICFAQSPSVKSMSWSYLRLRYTDYFWDTSGTMGLGFTLHHVE